MNFGVPFRNGVVFEFYKATGIILKQNGNAFWTGLSLEDAERVAAWMQAQGSRVYLKDFYDCSIALGERSIDGEDTALGALFSIAKYQQDKNSAVELAKKVRQTIEEMHSFKDPFLVTCPPPRKIAWG
jgi:hypothetical protein